MFEVEECSRGDCWNIASFHSYRYGYLCHECYNELREFCKVKNSTDDDTIIAVCCSKKDHNKEINKIDKHLSSLFEVCDLNEIA